MRKWWKHRNLRIFNGYSFVTVAVTAVGEQIPTVTILVSCIDTRGRSTNTIVLGAQECG